MTHIALQSIIFGEGKKWKVYRPWNSSKTVLLSCQIFTSFDVGTIDAHYRDAKQFEIMVLIRSASITDRTVTTNVI